MRGKTPKIYFNKPMYVHCAPPHGTGPSSSSSGTQSFFLNLHAGRPGKGRSLRSAALCNTLRCPAATTPSFPPSLPLHLTPKEVSRQDLLALHVLPLPLRADQLVALVKAYDALLPAVAGVGHVFDSGNRPGSTRSQAKHVRDTHREGRVELFQEREHHLSSARSEFLPLLKKNKKRRPTNNENQTNTATAAAKNTIINNNSP